MLPLTPCLLSLVLLAGPVLLTPSAMRELQVRGQKPTKHEQDSIKVVISEGCATHGSSSDGGEEGKEIALAPGSPLVLTHKIKLVPSGSGSCGCEADFAALRERLERLEREVSQLREKCEGAGGSCCNSESKGAGCSIKPGSDECPNECSDQGRCKDGKCVCFPGYSGPDCSESSCPENCNDKGRCVKGQCECDPGFSGPDCSQTACPDNCSNKGSCVNGRCVCDSGFTGPTCADKSCPGNCNRRGRCANGQCVCNPGFTGPDCSKKACPKNCNNHGRCENGKCVCDSGFTGADCSEIVCPGNCNRRGRCANGQCVCNPGFTGPDCSKKTCPNDCKNHGRCENGKCVCDSGFTGADCSQIACPDNCSNKGSCVNGRCVCDHGFTGPTCADKSCPGNCNNQGRCVNGQCICEDGFTGQDCSERTCPNNCSDRGQCVNGRCECSIGFAGEDCSQTTCPDSCSNNGKCVNGKCVCSAGFNGPNCATQVCPKNCSNNGKCVRGRCECQRGFTGKDCSQCQEGMKGTNCDTGVSQLRAQNITDTSVTLIWTPPSVQYETYNITFTSQKEGDQQIALQVEGHLTTFTQTGLAAGQKYRVSISGELKGRRGAENMTEFMTLISGPTNLRVVKTTSTTAVVQWEPSQGDIDGYHLTYSPLGGAGRTQEMTIGPGEDSAHIQQLEVGRMYAIRLVAMKGQVRSQPATTQVVPGKTIPVMTREALALQVPQTPGEDVSSMDQDLNPSSKEKQCKTKDGGEADSIRVKSFGYPNRLSTTVIARTKPLPGQTLPRNATRFKYENRSTLLRTRLINRFRHNGTTGVPVRRKVVSGNPIKPSEQAKPGVSNINKSVGGKSLDPPSSGRRDPTNPSVLPANETELQKPEQPASALGSNVQPQVGGLKPLSSLSSSSKSHLQPSLDSVNSKSASQTNSMLSPSSSSPLSLSALPSSSSSSSFDEFDSTGSDQKSIVKTKTATTSTSEGGAVAPQRRMHHHWYTHHSPQSSKIAQNKTNQKLRTPQGSRLNQTKQESLPSSSTSLDVNALVRDKIPNTRLTTGLGSSGTEHMLTERRRFVVRRPPPRGHPNPSFKRGQNQTSTNIRGLSPQKSSNPKDPSPDRPEPSRDERKGVGSTKSPPDLSFSHTTGGNGAPLFHLPIFNPPKLKTIKNSLPTKMPSNSITAGSQKIEPGKNSTPDNQEREQSLNRSTHGSQRIQSGEKEIAPIVENAQIDRGSTNTTAQIHDMEREDNSLIDTEKTSKSYNQKEKTNSGRDVGEKYKGISSQTNDSAKTRFDTESEKTVGATKNATSAGELLEFVRVTNRTSDRSTLTLGAPEGKYKNYNVGSTEAKKVEELSRKEAEQDHLTQKLKNGVIVDDNKVGQVTIILSTNGAKPTERKTVLPGSAQLHQFEDLPSQTDNTVALVGMGPSPLSSLHKLVISTGPEPPTSIDFSKVTENSLTVSWTKPRSSVSGFKVTYTHADEGEPVSVVLDSGKSSFAMSQLSPGSTYEVTIVSTLGVEESSSIRDFVTTLPDPPTDLRAINVTDSTALLLWRPAFAPINKYAIVYGSEADSKQKIMVSGNAAEHQLSALQESTTYTATIISQLGNLESSAATTSFTTTSGRDADGPRDLYATNVTPRTAMLSWKPPSKPVQRYLLTYQTEGQEIKEVIVDAAVTQYNLTRLHPGSLYSVQLIAIRGQHRPSISTKFKTGTLRFPYPTDCTEELLNGIHTSGEVEIFPQGKLGTPMMVYCDMETDGGGWMVFQRRKDGSEDFFRVWKDYEKGFGDLNKEFWLGLEKIHNLSTMAKMILRVDLRDGGESVFAKYSTFTVAKRNYKLNVGGYGGTAGDSLTYHNQGVFSTKDRDPKPFITRCAMSYRGGWWYKNCHEANLNGLYGTNVKHQGIIWTSWKGKEHSIQFTEMKMRPADFIPPAKQ